MGQYKVPQNVEAEDKILGPLSLKQFIYALIGLGWGALTFAILHQVIVLWVLIGLPPTLALLGLGLYQREDQPLETYVLAVVQYFTRPHFRIWQKEPIAQVFHLEPPPPKPEMIRRDPREVRGQLQKLAEVVDTRGWSAKQPELQEPEEAPVIDLQDRISTQAVQSEPLITAAPEVTEADDVFSTTTPNAESLNVLMENTTKSIRAEAQQKMRTSGPPAGATVAATGPAGPVTVILPTGETVTATAAVATSQVPSISGSTPTPSGAILKLATEGGDLTVAQIAAQARKTSQTLPEGQTVSLR